MMPRQDPRPVNLSLRHFHFPLNAWLSISHRLSGLLLVVGLLVGLVMLSHLLLQPKAFAFYQIWLSTHTAQILLLIFVLVVWFHWLAGLRFLLIDLCHLPLCQNLVRRGAGVHLTIWLLGSGILISGWLL
jgi:succinate dehydrogenase / fumarate reductase cytochrome b subunit